jgi:hypothetical protein
MFGRGVFLKGKNLHSIVIVVPLHVSKFSRALKKLTASWASLTASKSLDGCPSVVIISACELWCAMSAMHLILALVNNHNNLVVSKFCAFVAEFMANGQ